MSSSEAGADINTVGGEFKFTLLSELASTCWIKRYLGLAEELIQLGADISFKDPHGKVALERLYTALRGQTVASQYAPTNFTERFETAMKDDFNTAVAVSVLFELVRELNKAKAEGAAQAEQLAAELLALADLLGLLKQDPEYFLQNSTVSQGLTEVAIQALIDERTQARKDKNFARSDEIRDELAAQGIELLDSREGTTWTRS